MVQNEEQLNLLLGSALAKCVNVWLKVDTGMHRLGFQGSEINVACNKLASCLWVNDNIVICSHFSCASDPADEDTRLAIKNFHQLCKNVTGTNYRIQKSIANSAALMSQPNALLDWNRPGIMLYGVSPFDDQFDLVNKLQPAMTLLSSVIAIRKISTGEGVGYSKKWTAKKDSIIATVAIGYADGYPRHATNGTPVMVEGQLAPLVGNVSMDMISIDITNCQ